MTQIYKFITEVDNYLKANPRVTRLDLRVKNNGDKAIVQKELKALGYRVEWTMQNELVLIR